MPFCVVMLGIWSQSLGDGGGVAVRVGSGVLGGSGGGCGGGSGSGGQSMSYPSDTGGGNNTGLATGGGGVEKERSIQNCCMVGVTALRYDLQFMHEDNLVLVVVTGASSGNASAASALTAELNENEDPPNNMVR